MRVKIIVQGGGDGWTSQWSPSYVPVVGGTCGWFVIWALLAFVDGGVRPSLLLAHADSPSKEEAVFAEAVYLEDKSNFRGMGKYLLVQISCFHSSTPKTWYNFFKRIAYLKCKIAGWEGRRQWEKEKQRKISFPLVHSPNGCKSQDWVRLHPGLPFRWQGPYHLGHLLLPSRCISWELNWNLSS